VKRIVWVFMGVVMAAAFVSDPAWAEIESDVVDMIAHQSYHKRKATLEIANKAAAEKKATIESLGKACNLMPIRIGAILSGQAPLEKKTEDCLESQLGLKAGELAPLAEPPARWNVGSIYRLHEAVDVYGPAIQRWMNEHFGDAIMSAIDFVVHVEEGKGSHGEKRMRIIFDGKALPYSNDEGWALTPAGH
jgi:cyanate lyase